MLTIQFGEGGLEQSKMFLANLIFHFVWDFSDSGGPSQNHKKLAFLAKICMFPTKKLSVIVVIRSLKPEFKFSSKADIAFSQILAVR